MKKCSLTSLAGSFTFLGGSRVCVYLKREIERERGLHFSFITSFSAGECNVFLQYVTNFQYFAKLFNLFTVTVLLIYILIILCLNFL